MGYEWDTRAQQREHGEAKRVAVIGEHGLSGSMVHGHTCARRADGPTLTHSNVEGSTVLGTLKSSEICKIANNSTL